MSDNEVWRLIGHAAAESASALARADLLAELLAALEPEDIAAFAASVGRLAAALDTPAVRAAAAPLVAGGDDRDFAAYRLWAVAQGRAFCEGLSAGGPPLPAGARYEPYTGDVLSAARSAYRLRTGTPLPAGGVG